MVAKTSSMDLSLTETQEMLRSTIRSLVRQDFPTQTLLDMDSKKNSFTTASWNKLTSSGWTSLLIPQIYGGEGGSLTDSAILFQELGRGPVPGPHFSSSVLGTLILLEIGSEDQKAQLLPKLAAGKEIIGLAHTESEYDHEIVGMAASETHENYVLNGTKLFVQDVLGTTLLIITARLQTDRLGLFLVDSSTSGLEIQELDGWSTGVSTVCLNNVRIPKSSLLGTENSNGWRELFAAVERALPVLCAYQIGSCEAVFDMTVEYANRRHQFGVPIGKFQRVQDHIISQINYLDAATLSTYEALWKLDEGKETAKSSVHLAKALTSEAHYQICNASHEVHAGLGIMREYGLTLHTKLSRTLYHYFGDPKYHKKQLIRSLNL